MKPPEITIITVTYNRALFLPNAIESVLEQSFTDWEMLVVDDASTDNTAEVVAEYRARDRRIRYHANPENLRISRSRNVGLSLAAGAYVAVLDSDDAWCNPDKLALQHAFLKNNRDYALVGGAVIVVDARGMHRRRYRNPVSDAAIRRSILIRNPFAHSSVTYDADIVRSLGGYDETLDVAEDYDLWLRIGKTYKFANLDSFLVNYRTHASNISITERLRAMETNIMLLKRHKDWFTSYNVAMARRTVRIWAYRLLASKGA